MHDRHLRAIRQPELDALGRLEAEGAIERLTRQGGDEGEGTESRRVRGHMALGKEPAPEPPPGPAGVHEERANAGGLRTRVEQGIFGGVPVAGNEGAALSASSDAAPLVQLKTISPKAAASENVP